MLILDSILRHVELITDGRIGIDVSVTLNVRRYDYDVEVYEMSHDSGWRLTFWVTSDELMEDHLTEVFIWDPKVVDENLDYYRHNGGTFFDL